MEIQVSLSGRTQTRLPLRSSQDHSYGDTKYKGKGYTYSPTESITCSRNHPPLVAHGKVIHLVITHGLTWPHVCIHVSPPPSHGWEPQPIIPTNSAVPFWPNRSNKPLFLGESSTRIHSFDQREEDDDDYRGVGSYYDSVFRPVPSRIEVDKAISDLQRFMLGLRTSEFEWLQKMLYLHNPSMLKSLGFGNVDDAFRLLQIDPSVQRMVSSISSDKAVWDAILSNKAVQNLQQSLSAAKEVRPQSSSEKPDLATMIVEWILDIAKAKVLELIEQFISLVTMIFQPPEQKKKFAAQNTDGRLDEKLRSSLLLSIIILLIVVVTRAHGVS